VTTLVGINSFYIFFLTDTVPLVDAIEKAVDEVARFDAGTHSLLCKMNISKIGVQTTGL
jgi:hypothetical protein